MASGETDLSSLGTSCLSLSKLLASQGRAFSLKLTIGHHFSFYADSKGMRSLPARESPEGNWTKKKSPSAIRRDRRRRSEFLRRKEPSHSPDTSKLDTGQSLLSDLPVQHGWGHLGSSDQSGGNPGHPRHRSAEQEQQEGTQQRQCIR